MILNQQNLLKEESKVQVRIYDIRGELIRDFNLGIQQPGDYTRKDRALHWDGKNKLGEPISSGIYLIELQTNNYRALKKMAVEK